MQKNFINKYAEYIVKCWTGKYLNWGNKVLSRGESQHGVVKNELGISRGDLKDVVDKYRNLLTCQYNEIMADFSAESQKFIRRFGADIFFLVVRKVSIYALDLVFKQYSKLKPPHGQKTADVGTCSTLFRSSYGLSCAYEIQRRLDAKELLQLQNFHPYWFYDRDRYGRHIPPLGLDLIQNPEIIKPKDR